MDSFPLYPDFRPLELDDAALFDKAFREDPPFGLMGAAIKVNDGLVAACLAQRLNPSTLVMHMLKADSQITGLHQSFLQEFLTRQAQGFEFINLEQDLGIGGLRKAKLSYQPCALVKKYTLGLS
ncbi:MAG: phosphatidylglycerol lysyltransferase domain-containing protein [Candidatus Omnitrophota bacterium]